MTLFDPQCFKVDIWFVPWFSTGTTWCQERKPKPSLNKVTPDPQFSLRQSGWIMGSSFKLEGIFNDFQVWFYQYFDQCFFWGMPCWNFQWSFRRGRSSNNFHDGVHYLFCPHHASAADAPWMNRLNRWEDGWMDGWIGWIGWIGWMDGWMNGYMF